MQIDVKVLLTFLVTTYNGKLSLMDSRYRLIDDCLKELRHCEIPAIPKLRLEVQLFQIKLLLLRDEVSRDTKVRYCSESVLQKLHRQMAGLRDGDVDGVAIAAVSRRLQQLALDLSEAVQPPAKEE